MRTTRMFGAVVLLLAGVSAGCGATNRESGTATQVVEVHNDLIPPVPLTVSIVSETGGGRLLGTVQPSSRESFELTPPAATGLYRLTARTTEGKVLASEIFSVGGGETARWDVRANIVHVAR